MRRNKIYLELTRSANGFDFWFRNGNEHIPLYDTTKEDVGKYALKNYYEVKSPDIMFASDIPYMIDDYFRGISYGGINKFFKLFFRDVLNENLKRVLQEEDIRPSKDCSVTLSFRKSFHERVAKEIKLD